MTDIAVFNYSDLEVRTVLVDGEPWFVARDILDVLGLTNATEALRGLDDDEFSTTEVVDSAGRRQPHTYIVNEAGLYSLILRSRKPEAKAFKRWITHEVLPAIRKTGRYETAPAMSVASIGRRELALMVIEAEDRAAVAEQALAEAAPKVEAWDHLASAEGDYAVANAAKILSRHPLVQVGQRRLFTLLAEQKWIYRRWEPAPHWTVYQYPVDRGWLTEKPSSHCHPRTGELVLDPPQVRVTVKGLAELQRRLTGTQTQIAAA
jgi:prophage antirepressor-like protein